MYIPPSFAAPDPTAVIQAIEEYSFAFVVSGADGDLVASHLPLLYDRTNGPHGTLLGHMARANAQWQTAAGRPVLAVFSGPHAYVSPRWYEAERVVPTWNYLAVHAYGRLELVEEPGQAEAILRRTIAQYEGEGWQIPTDRAFVEGLLRQIVAFRIPVQRLEGKWKLSQNQPPARREKVAAALEQSGREADRAVAREMRRLMPPAVDPETSASPS
jgi:transcriptional regulator